MVLFFDCLRRRGHGLKSHSTDWEKPRIEPVKWQAHFWPQGHNLKKLGKGPLGEATYQISMLYAL